jgi:tetratricopeptide (TPR) repeat protein
MLVKVEASQPMNPRFAVLSPLRHPPPWGLSAIAVLLATTLWAQGVDPKEAQSALDRGEYRRAEALYRSLLEEGPPSAELLNNLGLALQLQGKSSEAIQVFRRALRLKELPSTLALLALNYCKLRQFEDAAPVLSRARRYLPDTNVLEALGACYLEAGNSLEAVHVYEELVKQGVPPPDENAVDLARAYFWASKDLLEQLERTPGNQVYMRAIQAARENASPDARGAFGAAMRSAPYLKADMSVPELEKALATHPNDPALQYVLGVICGEQAMRTFWECQQRYADSVAVRRLHAEMLAVASRRDEAIAEYKALLARSSSAFGLHYDLATLYSKTGDWEKALEEFTLQRRAAPDDERAVAGISESLLRLERFEELRRYLQPLIATKDPPAWALRDAASAAEELGMRDSAIRYLRRAVVLNPDNPTLRYRLSRLYSLNGQPEEARRELAVFRRLKGLPPD